MFKKMRKWLFWGLLLIATGSAAVKLGQNGARLIEKENQLLATAGQEAAQAIRSVGEAGEAFLSRAGEEQMTVLFTGLNESWSEPEAIMLIAADLDAGSVRVIQIPSDTYVDREQIGICRIGEIYTHAYRKAVKRGKDQEEAIQTGAIALKGFIKANMGIAIDHHIELSENGLATIVEKIGGVTVKLPKAIDHDDDRCDLHIHLSAGEHTLSGKEAGELIRLGSVSQESKTQKAVFSAVFSKIKQEMSIPTALGLLDACKGNLASDLSLPDLFPLTRGLLNISPSQVKLARLQGSPTTAADGSPCYLLNRSQAIAQLAAAIPFRSSIDEAHFDPDHLFTQEATARSK